MTSNGFLASPFKRFDFHIYIPMRKREVFRGIYKKQDLDFSKSCVKELSAAIYAVACAFSPSALAEGDDLLLFRGAAFLSASPILLVPASVFSASWGSGADAGAFASAAGLASGADCCVSSTGFWASSPCFFFQTPTP